MGHWVAMHIISVFSWLALANAEMREESQICTCIMRFSVKSECGFHRFVKCATHVNLSYSKEGCNIFMFFREWQKSILTINHVLKSCCILLIIYWLYRKLYALTPLTIQPWLRVRCEHYDCEPLWCLRWSWLCHSIGYGEPNRDVPWKDGAGKSVKEMEVWMGTTSIIIYIYVYIYKWSI
jgi:hypothetical protein